MKHSKERFIPETRLWQIFLGFLPSFKDNIPRALLKLSLIAVLVFSLIFTSFFTAHFLEINRQHELINEAKALWHSPQNDIASSKEGETAEIFKTFLKQNSDFKGWLTVGEGEISLPVYQTENNSFYINHNAVKKQGDFGALFFDKSNKITEKKTDRNLIIYGNNMEDGSLFGSLYKLRSINYLRKNYKIDLSVNSKKNTYKIFAVFILNAKPEDDKGNVFNIYRQSFDDTAEFYAWINEAQNRSLIKADIDLKQTDGILTLVTRTDDFEDSRLVVMARKIRSGESTQMNPKDYTLSPNPKYPEKWYTSRGINK